MDKPAVSLRGAIATISENLQGEINIKYREKPLKFREYGKQEFMGEIVNSKEIEKFLREKPARKKVPSYHPWKRGQQEMRMST